jgi:hypothetical protein
MEVRVMGPYVLYGRERSVCWGWPERGIARMATLEGEDGLIWGEVSGRDDMMIEEEEEGHE